MKSRLGKWILRLSIIIIIAGYISANTMYWPSFFWFTVMAVVIGAVIWFVMERNKTSNKIETLPRYIHFAQYLGGIVALWISLNVFHKGFTLAFDKYPVFYDLQWGLLLVLALVTIGILVGEKRMFCKFLCPIGVILTFLNAIPFRAKYRVRTINNECIKCGKCNKECLMGIKPMEDIEKWEVVKDENCINCLSCVAHCPKDAIDFKRSQEFTHIKESYRQKS